MIAEKGTLLEAVRHQHIEVGRAMADTLASLYIAAAPQYPHERIDLLISERIN